jgi:RNA ligase
MSRLTDMLDAENLARHVDAGTVALVRHPTEPLRLYNYTQRCQFTGAWDAESRACRGLIVADDDEIVARPFPKFHNLHEHGPDSAAGPLTLVPPLSVLDKLDGSLGIAYRRPSDGSLAWATRGSFMSEQAQWATAWWADHHYGDFPVDGTTWLAEIIYPANRIVLDYGDRAGLTLLATIDNATGEHIGSSRWPDEFVDSFGVVDDIAALDRNDRPNAEGYVVLSGDRLTRVKLKADEYMRLHKILTGASSVTVWELLSNGDPLDVLYEKVPDEFAGWAQRMVDEITAAFNARHVEACDEYDRISHLLPDRKVFAAEAVKSEHRAVLFRLADGKDVAPLIWRDVKPERTMPYLLADA